MIPILVPLSSVITAAILSLALGLGLLEHSFTRSLEFAVQDALIQSRAADLPHQDIVLIDIEESSLAAIGAWPWSRSILADLVDDLTRVHGARIVALDIVLPNARDTAGDKRLLELAKQKKLVLSQVFDYVERDAPINSGTPAGSIQPRLIDGSVSAKGILANHAGLSQAPCVGNIGYQPDPDGKLRRLVQLTNWGGDLYPSLALSVVQCLPEDISKRQSREAVQILRFDRSPQSWEVVRARDILTPPDQASRQKNIGHVPPNHLLKNKIVVVGSSAMGLSDRVSTPLSPNISGMYVHAQAISEMLNTPVASTKKSGFILINLVSVGLVIVFGLILVFSQRLKTLVGSALFVALIWLFFVVFFTFRNYQIHATAALWGFLFLLITIIPLKWAAARKEIRKTTRLLSRYVSKPVLNELLAQKGRDPLKARKARITVLVADMAAYTELTKSKTLEDIADITKQFLECISEPIWSLRGTLDRYSGDGLVAFWGAPVASEDQADRAIEAALRIQKNIKALNQSLVLRGLPAVSARIGIASGEALVGDFGTRFRATYTAVGTCINLATRLEALVKKLQPDLPILMSADVANHATRHQTRRIGLQAIQGLGEIEVYTLNRSIT